MLIGVQGCNCLLKRRGMDGKGKRWRDAETGARQAARLLQPKPEAAFLQKPTTQRRKRDKREGTGERA